MPNRRELLNAAIGGVLAVELFLIPEAIAASAKRLVLVHGRAQGGLDPQVLKSEWLAALARGNDSFKGSVLKDIEVEFPYYGDLLDGFAARSEIPLTPEVHEKGGPALDDFVAFQGQVAEAIRARAGITDAEVDAEYGSNPKPKGLENSEYVLAIVRAIDKRFGGVSGEWIKGFMRDVFLYTKRAGVRTEVDKIVTQSLNEEPTIVVAHSLGAVVAYNVLRSDPRRLNIPLLVTVGCPLGIRPIRDEFRPLRFPAPVSVWYNAYDKRDVVALYPLDRDNFPVSPSVHNYDGVNNQTENRHGIDGYLDDPDVAKEILSAIKA